MFKNYYFAQEVRNEMAEMYRDYRGLSTLLDNLVPEGLQHRFGIYCLNPARLATTLMQSKLSDGQYALFVAHCARQHTGCNIDPPEIAELLDQIFEITTDNDDLNFDCDFILTELFERIEALIQFSCMTILANTKNAEIFRALAKLVDDRVVQVVHGAINMCKFLNIQYGLSQNLAGLVVKLAATYHAPKNIMPKFHPANFAAPIDSDLQI